MRPASATQSTSSRLGRKRVPEWKSALCLLHKGARYPAKMSAKPGCALRDAVDLLFWAQLPILLLTGDEWQPVGPWTHFDTILQAFPHSMHSQNPSNTTSYHRHF